MYASVLGGMVLREGVAVADVRVLDAVEQHVHAADAEHRVVEVEAVEHARRGSARALLGVVEQLGMVLAEVLAGRDQEAGRAAGRVADDVGRASASIISTISRMMWRGVRNWPFCPAVAILPSMYS